MNWQDLQVSSDWTHFTHEGRPVFRRYLAVLKFHAPGLAPVQDESGWHILDATGTPIGPQRYEKAWGYYGDRCAVQDASGCFHILPDGQPAYITRFQWCG